METDKEEHPVSSGISGEGVRVSNGLESVYFRATRKYNTVSLLRNQKWCKEGAEKKIMTLQTLLRNYNFPLSTVNNRILSSGVIFISANHKISLVTFLVY